MSLATVMKNVYTFAQILGQAGGKTAKHWDIQALQNATRWAAYCEQIYHQVKNKRVEKALDQQLLDMAIMMDPTSCVCLSVELLGQASHLLQKTLLENPQTSLKVVSHLVAERKRVENEVMQRFSDMISRNCITDLPDDVLHILDDVDLPSIDVRRRDKLKTATSESPVITAQATVILNHLMKLIHLNTTETQFDHILERTSCLKHGWEIVICMMYTPLGTIDSSETLQHVKNGIIRWMGDRREIYLKLWSVPLFMLRKAADKQEEFCQLYLNILTWLANQMEVDYHQLTNGRLYSWRYNCDDTSVVLEDLVERYQSLLDGGGSPRTMALSMLVEKTQTSYFNIWKDVCRKLH